MHYHDSPPFGNTTIYINGHPSNIGHEHHHDSQPHLGNFFQSVLAQLAGGLTAGRGGGAQFPL